MPKTGGLDRRCHWLSPNKRSTRPSAIIFLDAEAHLGEASENRQEHEFRLATACLCLYSAENGLQETEWVECWCEDDLWLWVVEIARQHKDLLVISHNMDYDARLCRAFSYLPHLGWSPAYAIMSRSCTLFSFECEEHKLLLLDNMNWWQVSLAQIGESVGLEKLSVDFEQVADRELAKYCRRDVEILVRLWQRWFAFLDQHDLGSFGITAAKQSFNAYRHRFMPCKIGIHNDAVAAELARAAYHGGRVECFFVGHASPGTYYKLDVNALYAAMMKWYPQPRKLVKVIQNVSVGYLDHLLRDYLVIAEVAVEARDPLYVKEIAGRNSYPTGTFLVTLTTPELKIALANDEIRGIGRVALYESGNLFEDYVDYFTPLRAECRARGDLAGARMCKLLRNTLSGKFGQRGFKQEIIGDAPIDKVAVRHWIDAESFRKCTDWTFGGKVLRQYSEGEGYDSLPAIPAHITAYGRIYMWSLIQTARSEHVFYMDTDSLITDQVGFDNLSGVLDPSRVGYLKQEGTASDLTIFAKKDYSFGDLRVTKGIQKNAVQLTPTLFEQWHFTTIRYAFQSGSLDGVTVARAQKKLRYGQLAGQIEPDGRVRPPHLHLPPGALASYLVNCDKARVWTWEFNSVWLRDFQSQVDLQERELYEISLLSPQ